MSIVQQYGPLLAAGIALFGVLVTVRATTRRELERARLDREDRYRQDARAGIAVVLTGATLFSRYGQVMSVQWRWVRLGFVRSTEMATATENAMRDLNASLEHARLLVRDEAIAASLEDLVESFSDAASQIHSAIDAFWDGGPAVLSEDDVPDVWQRFHNVCAELRNVAGVTLSPTVRAER